MVNSRTSSRSYKKRRRLKKSVRRGCFSIFFFFLFFLGLAVYECQRKAHQLELSAYSDSIGSDQTDTLVIEQLNNVIHRPEFTDTNKLSICVYDLTRQCSVLNYHSDRLMIPSTKKFNVQCSMFNVQWTSTLFEIRLTAFCAMLRQLLSPVVRQRSRLLCSVLLR